MSYATTKRLVIVNILNESTDKLVCGQCSKNTVGDVEEETIQNSRKVVDNDGVNTTTSDIIDRFVELKPCNRARNMNQAENKYKAHCIEDAMGISSDMLIQCNSKSSHCYPLTFHR